MKLTSRTKRLIRESLKEDIGAGDITTDAFISNHERGQAVIVAKEKGIFAGVPVAEEVFRALDPRMKITWFVKDGARVKYNQRICKLQGSLSAILKGERVALNFLSWLSGIATLTAEYVKRVRGTKVKIYDTRKTTPLWRELEKFAVRAGGGNNHRMNLHTAAFVKDNHWEVIEKVRDIAHAISKLKKKHCVVEIDHEHLKYLDVILFEKPAAILLDNFTLHNIKHVVRYIRQHSKNGSRPIIEVSGGVKLRDVRRIARTGVDQISIGSITHSAPALDLSLKVEKRSS